jgi:organic hydroperoxide reductase OsmC/OhrA
VGEVRGEVEKEGGVLVLRRVHVRYLLRTPEEERETVERVHAVHADSCPVARSLKGAVDVTTEVVYRKI